MHSETEINLLDFDAKRSKVKVTTRFKYGQRMRR